MGERIRQSFKTHPKLKMDLAVIDAVVEVVECINLRRGRQSFVMALGFSAASPVAGRIARFLADADIDGQVLDTLLKMRASHFATEVAPLTDAKKAWVRNLAKKYMTRYAAAA
jgi:hypothetical protein